MPLHYPGHNYCGPFTTDLNAEPLSSIDECCRVHDIQYGNPSITTRAADAELVDCLRNTESTSGTVISAIIQGKEFIDTLTNYASDGMLRREAKRKAEDEQQAAAVKKAKANAAPDDDLDLTVDSRGLFHKDGSAYAGSTILGENLSFDSARMEQDGGEPQVGPGDTAVGAVTLGNLQPSHADTAGIRTLSFSRTFQHYVTNSENAFGVWDYVPMTGTYDGDLAKLTIHHTCFEIPYGYLNGSMTRAEMETFLTPSASWRISSAGFKVTNVLPLIDQKTQVGGSVHTSFLFDSRPQLLTYVDSKQGLFQQSQWQTTLPNANMKHNLPSTREEGQLKHITSQRIVHREWFKQQFNKDMNAAHQSMHLDELLSLWNTQEIKFLNPGQTWQYTWLNSNPYWYNNMAFTMHGDTLVDGPILSIDRLLPIEVHGAMRNMFRPDGKTMNFSKRPGPNHDDSKDYKDEQMPTPGRSVLSQMPMFPSAPPPIAVLAIPPILNSENKTGNICWQITCMYECTIQIETLSGSPQYAGFMPAQTDFYRDKFSAVHDHRRTQLCQWPTGLRNYASNITTDDSKFKLNMIYNR